MKSLPGFIVHLRLTVPRPIKEGTSAVLSQSDLDEKWWADSMECHCYLRNVQDLLSDGKTPCERRFLRTIQRASNTFRIDEKSRLRQFCKTFLGIFQRYALYAGGIWKRDILVAYFEELGNLDASRFQARRLNAKEVIMPNNGEHFIFPIADATRLNNLKRSGFPKFHLNTGVPCTRRRA